MDDVWIPLFVCKSGVVFHSRPYPIMYLVLTFYILLPPKQNWPTCKLHDMPTFPRTFSYVLIHSLSATTEQRTPVTLALIDAVASVSNLQFTDQDSGCSPGGGGLPYRDH